MAYKVFMLEILRLNFPFMAFQNPNLNPVLVLASQIPVMVYALIMAAVMQAVPYIVAIAAADDIMKLIYRDVGKTKPQNFMSVPMILKKEKGDQSNVCNNCKRTGHFARDYPNVAVCNTCRLPGHIAVECSTKTLCWNCREPGHMASTCPNEGICHSCGKAGHRTRDCPKPDLRPGGAVGGSRDVACRSCGQMGHMSRDGMSGTVICHNYGERGHMAFACPSARFMDRGSH
ncbi:Cellular nucleic acid-binding protein-like protein, partial [Drosera capensis]